MFFSEGILGAESKSLSHPASRLTEIRVDDVT